MITWIQAIELAKKFTSSQGEIVSGIYLVPSVPNELNDFFYFDFKMVDKNGNEPEVKVAGAPGFTINKQTGEAKIVSWLRYNEIIRKEIQDKYKK